MALYYLFIDTETSGRPKRWDRTYQESDNWPYILQVAWVIYDTFGKEISRHNFYVGDFSAEIDSESQAIHGLTLDIIREKGSPKQEILAALSAAIEQYKPCIVGHFLEFDLQVLAAEYFRLGLKLPFSEATFFCTMLQSRIYLSQSPLSHFKLSQLYSYLFRDVLTVKHDAEQDALTTATCFFEQQKRGEITAVDLADQQAKFTKKINFHG